MEYATIAVVMAVAILQIVTIAVVSGLRKQVRELAEVKSSAPAGSAERPARGDQAFRRTRRPQDSRPNRPAPQATGVPASADPVEKSLRDINLRLKNAERDQEFARKRLQDNLQDRPTREGGGDRAESRDRGPRDSRGPRDGRGPRDSRGPRDGRDRDHRRDNRDNRGRGNWQERQDYQRNPQGAPGTSEEGVSFEAQTPTEGQIVSNQIENSPAFSEASAPEAFQGPDMVPTDLGVSEENLQHGRKAHFKRRALGENPGGEEGEAVKDSSEPVASAPEQPSEKPDSDSPDQSGDTEIRFGRR